MPHARRKYKDLMGMIINESMYLDTTRPSEPQDIISFMQQHVLLAHKHKTLAEKTCP